MKSTIACAVLLTASVAFSDDKADEYIKSVRGQSGRDEQRQIIRVNFGNNRQVTDAGLRELAGLTLLTDLNLYGTNVTDAGLKELAPLKNLKTLNLRKTRLTDAGIETLAGFGQLTRLDLDDTAVTGAGLGKLASLKNLVHLGLESTGLTDAAMIEIGRLRHLTDLDLRKTRVTDAGIRELASLDKLRYLSLPNLDDRMLAELHTIGKLHVIREAVSHEGRPPKNLDDVGSLYLSGKPLTDGAVKELARYRTASTFYLSGTKITDAGAAELQRALPKCTIVR
jgi:internalin A